MTFYVEGENISLVNVTKLLNMFEIQDVFYFWRRANIKLINELYNIYLKCAGYFAWQTSLKIIFCAF